MTVVKIGHLAKNTSPGTMGDLRSQKTPQETAHGKRCRNSNAKVTMTGVLAKMRFKIHG